MKIILELHLLLRWGLGLTLFSFGLAGLAIRLLADPTSFCDQVFLKVFPLGDILLTIAAGVLIFPVEKINT